jgi:GNAT superfamily N-acetyltransferase
VTTETARPAVDADLPRLAELAAHAIAELAPTKGGGIWSRREARPEPLIESLTHAAAAEDHHVLCGLLEDTIVGYAVARTERLRDGSRLGIVEDLYVEPAFREVGVGEVLMDALIEWCRQQDCFGVDALTLPGNRETKNFFESFGLVARAIVVHRPLS